MGKQRRSRNKFHSGAPRAPQETITDAADNSDKMSIDGKSVGKLSFKLHPKDGVFDGVDIAISNLNTFLSEDTKSVHSLAKTFRSVKRSLGGKSLKKDEKKKLRHDMFLSKIDAFYKHREMSKKKKSKKQPEDVSIRDLDAALPAIDMVFHQSGKKTKQPRPVSTKQKGIKKAKQRQKEAEQNLEAFKKIMQDTKSKDTGVLQNMVLRDLEKKLIGENN